MAFGTRPGAFTSRRWLCFFLVWYNSCRKKQKVPRSSPEESVVHRTFDSGEVAPNWRARGLPGYLKRTEVLRGSASRCNSLALSTLVLQANPLQRILSKCLKARHYAAACRGSCWHPRSRTALRTSRTWRRAPAGGQALVHDPSTLLADSKFQVLRDDRGVGGVRPHLQVLL